MDVPVELKMINNKMAIKVKIIDISMVHAFVFDIILTR